MSTASRTLVKVGTPVDIPDTTDGSGDKKPVPLHDQVAVDERVSQRAEWKCSEKNAEERDVISELF